MKIEQIEKGVVTKIISLPSYLVNKENEQYIGEYFIIDNLVINHSTGEKWVRGELLTGGWRLNNFQFELKNLEVVDQEGKWTVSFYPGSGPMLISLEVSEEDDDKVIEKAVKRIYKKYFDKEKNELLPNNFIMTYEQASLLKDDEYYNKDFQRLYQEGEYSDFGEFLENYYNYILIDVEDIGLIYVISGEYLQRKKGWGHSGMSFKENEEF